MIVSGCPFNKADSKLRFRLQVTSLYRPLESFICQNQSSSVRINSILNQTLQSDRLTGKENTPLHSDLGHARTIQVFRVNPDCLALRSQSYDSLLILSHNCLLDKSQWMLCLDVKNVHLYQLHSRLAFSFLGLPSRTSFCFKAYNF